MNEEEIIGTFEHWIEYEKANKDKINKADELIEIQQGLLNLYQKEKEDNKLYKLCMIQGQDFRDRLIEILGVGDNEETILQYITTLVSENARLEDIEDRKVQIEYELVFNKGVKSFKDKIRAKIKELEKRYTEHCYFQYDKKEVLDICINELKELLEEE